MMSKKLLPVLSLVALIATVASAEDDAPKPKPEEKQVSGMSIVGNDEAPKSLVIVPWKSSDLGDTLDVAGRNGSDRGPIDREVFLRALIYYQIRTGTAAQ